MKLTVASYPVWCDSSCSLVQSIISIIISLISLPCTAPLPQMMQSNAGQQSHPEIRKEDQPQLFTLVLKDDNDQTYKRILSALIVNKEQQRVELLYLDANSF